MSNASIVGPRRNNMVTPRASLSGCGRNWRRRAGAGMMLGLSLFCGGCAHTPGLAPSVLESPQGNAVLLELPAGTALELPSREASDMARALFVNELAAGRAVPGEPGDGSRAGNGAAGTPRPTFKLGLGRGGEERWGRPPRLTGSGEEGRGRKDKDGQGRTGTGTNGAMGNGRWAMADGKWADAETRRGNTRLMLRKPLRLATPAYILERDARELELLQRIEELKVEMRGK